MSKTSQRKVSAFNYGRELFREFKLATNGKSLDTYGYYYDEYKKLIRKNTTVYAGFQDARIKERF